MREVGQVDQNKLRALIYTSDGVARREYLDRNPIIRNNWWTASVAGHGWTQRWTYTVPAGKKALVLTAVAFGLGGPGAAADEAQEVRIDLTAGGVTSYLMFFHRNVITYPEAVTYGLFVLLVAGNVLTGYTRYWNNTLGAQPMAVGAVVVEFDA